MKEIIEKLREEIRDRIDYRVRSNRFAFARLGLEKFYIAGGALQPEEPNDYDLFPVGEHDFDRFFTHKRGEKSSEFNAKIWETSNAITYKINGIKIQLCKFWNSTLKDTVERFDFGHCKIGVEFKRYIPKQEYSDGIIKPMDNFPPVFEVVDTYVSPDFIKFRILGYSEYSGVQENDFPLSSLLRTFKYIKKGYIRSSYDVIFKILEAFLERGYKDEEDFRQQLLGIDIGIDEAGQLDENAESLKHIYYLITGEPISNLDLFSRDFLIGEKLK